MGLATIRNAVNEVARASRRGKSVAMAAGLCIAISGSPATAAQENTIDFPKIKVTTSDGEPVSDAQVIVRRKDARWFPDLEWKQTDTDGVVQPEVESFPNQSSNGTYEALVRKPGFATSSTAIDLPTSDSVVSVKMAEGKQVKLQLKDDAGRPIPSKLLPAVFPESWGTNVWRSIQEHSDEKLYAPEAMFSPVAVTRAEGGGTATGNFTFNVDPKSTEPLYVLINQPGFLRAFQAGPFIAADLAASGKLQVDLPKPASLTAKFNLNGNKPETSAVTMGLKTSRKIPGAHTWHLRLFHNEMPPDSATLELSDLAPGKYIVSMTMGSSSQRFESTAYSKDESATLDAGASETISIKYEPFQKEWIQGPYTAKIKVLNLQGEPATGLPYQLTWQQREYGQQVIAEGKVPENGTIEVKGLAGIEKAMPRDDAMELPHGMPFFEFRAADKRLGAIYFFDSKAGKFVPDEEKTKEFTFNIPPAEGDPAPDFAMHDIVTSKTIHLSDFKGKTVLIDFWATWCGPCQGPMAENQEILRKHKDDWQDKAVILAVSIDDELETVIKHLDKNDWHETHNTWAAPDLAKPDEAGWEAPAAKLYGINSIPTMVLIGPDGVIRERGHMGDVEAAIEKELQAHTEKASAVNVDAAKKESADTATSAPERKGGGDLIKSPVNTIVPPSAETNYSAAGHAVPSAVPAPIKTPSTETSYSASRAATSGPVRVALFADPGSTDKKSREAIWSVLSHTQGIAAQKVTTPTLSTPGFFNNFDVFVLPGGTASGEAKAIGADTGKAIAKHLKEGKGLVAICAGGYYVAEGWDPNTAALDVINAQNHDGKHWARGEQFIKVKVVGDDRGTSAIPPTMWYENGPIFKPAEMDELPGYVPLVKYITDLAAKDAPKGQMAGRDAVIAAPYGKGRVVAFGPHPELSPGLSHWLINAVKWAAGHHGDNSNINAKTVLEGRGE